MICRKPWVKLLSLLVSSGLSSLDAILGGEGYPEKSAVLAVGAPGVGKEALGYWFTHSGLSQGDFCLYVTRLSSREILKDARAFGVNYDQKVPLWISSSGAEQLKFDVNDLSGLSFNIKDILKKSEDRRIRIVTDIVSTLLMLYPPETTYRFVSQLIAEIKQHDAVLLATLEDGMHQPQVMTAMQQLFDGVVEFRIYEEGLRFVPILRIRKMIGVPPQPGYYSFTFSRSGMELSTYAK
jgi:circadian clock protein KaiC